MIKYSETNLKFVKFIEIKQQSKITIKQNIAVKYSETNSKIRL